MINSRTMTGVWSLWRAVIVAALVLLAASASAQPATLDEAAAQALFEEARQLMKDNRYSEACPKLEESLKLSQGAGVRFNLAQCYEQLGRLASAWSLYLQVVAETQRSGHEARANTARQHAERLRPLLGKLRINVSAPVAGLVVTRDGTDVTGQIGTAVPVDHGTHRIAANAPGYMPWTASIVVEGTQPNDLTVPLLRPLPDMPRTRGARGAVRRGVGLTAGGAGLAAMVVGVVLGVVADGKNEDALTQCNTVGSCTAEAVQLNEEAIRLGNIGTAVFVVGGVNLVGGGALFISGLEGDAEVRVAPRVGLHSTGLRLEASW